MATATMAANEILARVALALALTPASGELGCRLGFPVCDSLPSLPFTT
jgi:hypothetical protein